MSIEERIEAELACAGVVRIEIVPIYAYAILWCPGADWTRINAAIAARWSVKSLEYIKERAWAMRPSLVREMTREWES